MKFTFLCVLLNFGSLSAESIHGDDDNIVYFFYLNTCPHCHEAMKFFRSLQKEYPDLIVKYTEASESLANSEMFELMSEKYGTSAMNVPVMFFCRKQIVGFNAGEDEEKIRKAIDECYGERRKLKVNSNSKAPISFYSDSAKRFITGAGILLAMAAITIFTFYRIRKNNS